jgi:hypothetical protein
MDMHMWTWQFVGLTVFTLGLKLFFVVLHKRDLSSHAVTPLVNPLQCQ